MLNRGEISEQIIIEKLTLSKEREEDSLVAARLLDEEKLKQRYPLPPSFIYYVSFEETDLF